MISSPSPQSTLERCSLYTISGGAPYVMVGARKKTDQFEAGFLPPTFRNEVGIQDPKFGNRISRFAK